MTRRIAQPIAVSALVVACISAVTMFIIANEHINLNGLAFTCFSVLLVACVALLAAGWLSGLMLAARVRRWDWFVGILALGPIASLLMCLSIRREEGGRAAAV